jgi:hypothetical protein
MNRTIAAPLLHRRPTGGARPGLRLRFGGRGFHEPVPQIR